MVQSWKQGTSLVRDHRDGGTTRIYQGTGSNIAVTEKGPRQSPRRVRNNVSAYERAPSPQARYRSATSFDQANQQNNLNSEEFVQHRSPSPQRRYQERRLEQSPARKDVVSKRGSCADPTSPTHPSFDKSFAQSQKQMQQNRLEEQVSTLHYKLGQMEIQLGRHKQKSADAIQKCERMERDQEALKREHEAAVHAATHAALRLEEWKERENSKSVLRMQQELEQRIEQNAELRGLLATALSERDEALCRASQSAGVISVHHSDSSMGMGKSSMGIGVEVKIPSVEVEVKLPSCEVEVEVEVEVKAPSIEVEVKLPSIGFGM